MAWSLIRHYATLHNLYSHLFSYTGRFDQSILEAHRAEELDPLGERSAVQRALRFSRRFDLFLAEVDKTFAQEPARIHKERARVYQATKRRAEEVHEIDQELRIEGCVPCADRLATAYERKGYAGWLQERLNGLNEISKDGHPRPSNMPSCMQPWETRIRLCTILNRATGNTPLSWSGYK